MNRKNDLKLPELIDFLKTEDLPPYFTVKHMARKETVPTLPSFAGKIDEAVRKSRYAEQILGQDSFSRLARRREWSSRFLTRNGWRTPQVLVNEFQLAGLRNAISDLQQFVIKPRNATNAWGVVPAVRTGALTFRNLFDDREYRIFELLEVLNAPMQRYMFPNAWQIEELLLPPSGEPGALDDYKFYAFQGVIGLILQVRRRNGEAAYKWYDANWREVRTGKHEERIDPALPLPADPERMLRDVAGISSRLSAPFCRIDVYDTDQGVVVGELTPEPGAYYAFDDRVNAYLGVLYEQAEVALFGLPEIKI
jgi:hypothetical protein